LAAVLPVRAKPPEGPVAPVQFQAPRRQPAKAPARDADEIAYSVRFKLMESGLSGPEKTVIRPGARIELGKLLELGKLPNIDMRVIPDEATLPPRARADRGKQGATLAPEPGPMPAAPAPEAIDDAGWDALTERGTRVLAAPRLEVLADVPATIEMKTTQTFAFLEPLGENRFVAKRTGLKELGMKISFVAKPAESGDASVAVCELEFQTSALVGREPVEGLDLDVGKPIVSSWSLRTTATVKLGTTVSIVLPSGPGQEAMLLLNVSRSELADDKPLPPARTAPRP
jgi:hypothetical protein